MKQLSTLRSPYQGPTHGMKHLSESNNQQIVSKIWRAGVSLISMEIVKIVSLIELKFKLFQIGLRGQTALAKH